MYTLYGNGINDDAPAIQEMLDSGVSEVKLPVPQKHYYIGRTLKIHSNQTLVLGETTTIKLMPGSNCSMLANAEENAHDIAVVGGIWDCNNKEQAPNPIRAFLDKRTGAMPGSDGCHLDANPETVVDFIPDGWCGSGMRFYKVERFSIHHLTVKDPTTYCIEMAYVRYFTVENIKFDQNLGNPTAENMDGIHLNGGCRFGSIRNVQGTCYDDIVALNADDGCDGPIEDVEIDGVFGENSLRGVRLLSLKSDVARITISNVFGTFYQNCVGLTYFFPRSGNRGQMKHIAIRNIYGQNAPRRPEYNKNGPYCFSYVWIDSDLDIDFVSIDNLCRTESLAENETLKVCGNTKIKTMSLSNIVHDNKTGTPIPFMTNEATIGKLYMYNVDSGNDELLVNKGTINEIITK